MAWITANLPIVLTFLAGMAMLVIEAFIPGFGLAGSCGIILQIVAAVLVYMNYGAGAAVVSILVAVVLIIIAIVMSLRSAARGRLNNSKLILHDAETAPEADGEQHIGLTGETLTDLRPAGFARLNGQRVSVVSDGAFIAAGKAVKVLRTENGTPVVVPVSRDV